MSAAAARLRGRCGILLLTLWAFASVGCELRSSFPAEPQVNDRLRTGMTVQEVVTAFGAPANHPRSHAGVATLRYIAPIGSRTVEREGYVGFVVEFQNGRVSGFRKISSNPSFDPVSRPPPSFWFTWRV
ncbi:MAG: hypothetical protein H0W20_05535 [Chthoniobacterales bacterium]|nr:hypothetical protein [Chthoniobacterales bacterium]